MEGFFFLPTIKGCLNTLFQMDNGVFYYTIESILATIDEDEMCDISIAWKEVLPRFVSIALPKNSQFYELFKMESMRLHDTGKLNNLKKRWLKTPPKELCEREWYLNIEEKSLGMEKLFSIFVFLSAFILVSLCLVLIEMILKCWFDNPERQKELPPERELDIKLNSLVENAIRNPVITFEKKMQIIRLLNELI